MTEAYFRVDVDSFLGEFEAKEPSKFAGPDSASGFILVPEQNVLESKLKGFNTDMGQRSDTGARRRGRRGRGLNIHISDVANVDMILKEETLRFSRTNSISSSLYSVLIFFCR